MAFTIDRIKKTFNVIPIPEDVHKELVTLENERQEIQARNHMIDKTMLDLTTTAACTLCLPGTPETSEDLKYFVLHNENKVIR